MPIWRFRTFEEAERALWVEPGDPAILRRMNAVWSMAQPILAVAPPPRGIRKFRSIEEAQADRDAWDARRIEALRKRRDAAAQ